MSVSDKRKTAARRRNTADPRPIHIWTLKGTGRQFTTVTVRQDDGSVLCLVAEDPTIRETAGTPRNAERATLQRMQEARNPPDSICEEDAEDVRIARQRLRRGKFISQEEFLKWFGRRHAPR